MITRASKLSQLSFLEKGNKRIKHLQFHILTPSLTLTKNCSQIQHTRYTKSEWWRSSNFSVLIFCPSLFLLFWFFHKTELTRPWGLNNRYLCFVGARPVSRVTSVMNGDLPFPWQRRFSWAADKRLNTTATTTKEQQKLR